MGIKQEPFGNMPDGRAVSLFTLTSKNGMQVRITNFGGIITSILVPDRKGNPADITLGYDTFEPYLQNPVFFGAIVGRFANRIEKAEFELNGTVYKVLKNDGNNHLHGGAEAFHKKLWDAKIITDGGKEKLELKYRSPDMEEGYPGNLDAKVLYSLDDEGRLSIEYFATTDKETVVNLTNHAYWNLAGHNAGTVLNHTMQINAETFTVINDECIPTGEIKKVEGSPLDLRAPKRIGEGLEMENVCDQLKYGHGYDHNFVIDRSGPGMVKAAEVYEPDSGRRMCVFTDKPGIQFYSGNFLGGIPGKGDAVYDRRTGFCLETQHFPNSTKHKHFPSPVLRPGELYRFTTVYQFTADQQA